MSRSLLVLLLVAGCVPSLQGNTSREPNRQLPGSFGAPPGATSLAQETWSELFDSPELGALIETALRNNQELNIRVQEIIIARSEAAGRHGEYQPRVVAGAGIGVEHVGEHTSQGAADEATGLPRNLGDFTFGLQASWEVDIWKKLRSAAKAADLRYLASIEARNFVATQIIAEIARSYYELLAIDNQLEILARNIEILANARDVVRVHWRAARVTELAVLRFDAEVLERRSRRFQLEQQRVQLENRINFLVGRYPQPVQRNARDFTRDVPSNIQTGLPSQLLGNRPDVRQAELEVTAAKLDVKSAKAAFYPSLTIDAELGYRSFNPEHLVATPDSLVFRLAAGLVAPVLNRTAITAQYRSANARQLQAVFTFEQTLLQAFTDVANQLAVLANLEQSYTLQMQQVAALAHAVETSTLLFQSARADYMEVLLTRRDSLEAEMELVETKTRRFLAIVNLYQALGGGWRST